MTYNPFKYKMVIMTALLVMGASTSALAEQNSPTTFAQNFDILFNEEQSLDNEELDELRGGFITSNGMSIDFSFSTNTLLDGQLINQVVLNSAEQSIISSTPLRNIIQIGEGNSAFGNGTDISALPNVLTIVQNNLSDLTIQQVNLLDLQVSNFDNFIQQNFVPELMYQSTTQLAP